MTDEEQEKLRKGVKEAQEKIAKEIDKMIYNNTSNKEHPGRLILRPEFKYRDFDDGIVDPDQVRDYILKLEAELEAIKAREVKLEKAMENAKHWLEQVDPQKKPTMRQLLKSRGFGDNEEPSAEIELNLNKRFEED